MESNYNFYQNINNMNLQQNDSINKKEKSGKILDNNNNRLNSDDFFPPVEQEKEKDNVSLEETDNDKKDMNHLIPTDLMNKMTLISPIPKQNLPKKKLIQEILAQEREESFEERDKEDFSPEEEDSEDDDDSDSDLVEIKKEVKKEIENNRKEKGTKRKYVHFSVDLDTKDIKKENNNEEKEKKERSNKLKLNRTFSYNVNIKNDNINNESRSKSQIFNFFGTWENVLKKQLGNDNSICSDINKSQLYQFKMVKTVVKK